MCSSPRPTVSTQYPQDHKEAIKPDNFVPIIVPTDHVASKMILLQSMANFRRNNRYCNERAYFS
jgi:hypothetical protein